MLLQATQQTANDDFLVPVVVQWAAVFGALELLRRRWPGIWPAAACAAGRRPWLDVAVALLTVVAVLGLGQLWHAGVLRWRWPGPWDHAAYLLAQLVIWSPLAVALCWRRQPLASVWSGSDHLPARGIAGLGLGVLGAAVFLTARGEPGRLPEVLAALPTARGLAHFAPVYLEGVGLAFLFVRVEWALGARLAAAVPAVLFAVAHVPRALAAGESTPTIAAFFVFDTLLVAAVLLLVRRHRDVLTLGVAHWITDAAIGAW